MDPTDGRPQPPPDAGGEADLASTTEFRAFLAGDPVPTGAAAGPCSRAGRAADRSPGQRRRRNEPGLDHFAPRRRARAVAPVASRPAAPAATKVTRGPVRSSSRPPTR